MRGSAADRCNGNGHPAKDGSKRIFTGGGYCLPPARECPAPCIVRIWPLLRHSIWRGAPEQIEVAHAETVVRPLLVQHHVHALEHRLPPGVRRPAGTGAGADSSSGVTVDSQRSSSAPCTSHTASTSSRLGAAARSRPCSSWSGTNSEASPIAVNGLVDPRQQRRNHESCANTRWRRVSTADHSPPTRWCSEPLGIPWSRPSVAAQSARSCREASCRSAGSAERISDRTGCRRSSSASTYDVTSTPLTTRFLTSPSITADRKSVV